MKKINNTSVITAVIIALVLTLTGPPAVLAAPATPVNLLSAGNFVILSKTGITNVPTSAITGNIGTSPITGASIAGLDCIEVTGTIFTVDATGPACRTIDATLLGTAVSDMEAAYTAAAGQAAGVGPFLNVGAGTLTGLTFVPGVYTWGSNVTIPTDLTLDAQGDANAVWVFQITGMLDIAANKQITMIGGAKASNVFWQVANTVTIGAGSHFEGVILAQTNIAMITGATLTGRALAQTTVTLQSNSITAPAVPSNITLLTAAKATAQGLITANAPESTTPGNHVVGSLTTLTLANTAANATNASTQLVVDGQVVTLNAATAVYNAAIIAVPATPVNLLSAGNFVILSKTGITNIPTSAITGNIGTSPITGAAIAGLDCIEVTGTIFTVDATGPACGTTNAILLTTAVSDMETAYTAAAGQAAGVGLFLNVGAGTLTDLTFVPGVYTWGSNVTIPTNLILDAQGDANAVWVFQITGMLDVAANKQVIMTGGAQASNVFWQVADVVTLGAGSHFEGTILAKKSIAMITGATLTGRALAQTAVTLQSNSISATPKKPKNSQSAGGGYAILSMLTSNSSGGFTYPMFSTPTPSANTNLLLATPTPSDSGSLSLATPTPIPSTNSGVDVKSESVESTFQVAEASAPFSNSIDGRSLASVAWLPEYPRNLSRGSQGDDVKKLQTHLQNNGVYTYGVTGYFGPITQRALRLFQSKNKLPASGFFGPMTREFLMHKKTVFTNAPRVS